MEPLLTIMHDALKAGEVIKDFENAGMRAAQELVRDACKLPFFNRVASAGKANQYTYTLYAQTHDGGKKIL